MTDLLKDGKTLDMTDICTLLKNIDQRNKEIHEEVKQMRREINEELQTAKNKIAELETNNKELYSKLDILEKRTRKCNFVIFGLESNENNLAETFIRIVTDTLNVEITTKDLRDIYIIPKNKIIHVELTTYSKKKEIFSNLYKLKGNNIRFANELSAKELQENKVLVTQMKAARSRNLQAKISNNKLVICGEKFTYSQVVENPIDFSRFINASVQNTNKITAESSSAEVGSQKKGTASDLNFPNSTPLTEEGPKTRGKKFNKYK